MKTIDDLIDRVKEDLHDFQNPISYQEDEYYINCQAKADYAEDILSLLLELKKNESL